MFLSALKRVMILLLVLLFGSFVESCGGGGDGHF